jgi:predicted DNA-binding transcriptional regulator AlpA
MTIVNEFHCRLCLEADEARPSMNIPEFAELFGISVSHAFELAKSDELPVRVIRLGSNRKVLSRPEVHALFHKDKESS